MPDDSGVVSALRAQRPRRRAPTSRSAERPPAVPPQLTTPPAPAATPPVSPVAEHQLPVTRDAEPAASPPAASRDTSRLQTVTEASSDASRDADEILHDDVLSLPAPLAASPDDPTVNFAVRVRRPFDELLSRRIGELRAGGVRSSKVELTEMLLAELALATADDLESRLAVFRRHAPR
jgi:hypothetical protein